MSVFEREAGVQICHLLLWAGFENMPYDEVGLVLSQHPDLTSLWRAITYALINDEWINVTAKKDDPKEDGEHKMIGSLIKELERLAISDLNMKPMDFYALTPREFNLLLDNCGLRDNLRAGLICATMANIHARKENDRPYEPGDFIRCGSPASRKDGQTAQEQSAIVNTIFGG